MKTARDATEPSRRLVRAYWTCHFLRWLPLGLAMPVMALLPLDRGVSLGQIGILFGVYNATSAILELPTGTLADVLGNKPVLVCAAILETTFYLGFAVAPGITVFVLAAALGGVGRALASGALEAWYVDRAYEMSPNTDVRPTIGTAMFLTNVAVLVGSGIAVAVSIIPQDRIPAWADVSMLPFMIAVPCALVQVIALLTMLGRGRATTSTRTGRRELKRIPSVVWTSVRFSTGPGNLRLLMATGLAIGVSIGAVEAFWQPAIARMLADPATATTVCGLLVAGSTLIGGGGSLIAARIPTRVARHARLLCAGLFLLLAGSIVGLALAPSFAAAAIAFLCVYLFLELRAPLSQTLLHLATPTGHRASVLSAYSMSTSAGAVVASFGLGAIVGRVGLTGVWLFAAAVVAVASVAYLRLRPTVPPASANSQPDVGLGVP